MKMIKIASAAMALLLVLSASLLWLLFDGETLQRNLSSQLKTQTGWQLDLRAPPTLGLLPGLSVHIGPGQITDPETGAEPLASWSEASLSVQWLPLLSGELRFGQLNLDKLVLDYQFRSDQEPGKRAQTAGPSDAGSGIGNWQVSIDALRLTDARLQYRDEGAVYTLRQLQLTSGRLVAGEPAALSGQFLLDTPQRQEVPGDFQARLLPDVAARRFVLDQMRLQLAESQVDGDVALIAATVPELNATLRVNRLDMRAWSAPPANKAMAVASATDPADTALPELPVIAMALKLEVAELQRGESVWRDLLLNLDYRDSVFRINRLRLRHDNGELDGSASLAFSALDESVAIDSAAKLRVAQRQPQLLADLSLTAPINYRPGDDGAFVSEKLQLNATLQESPWFVRPLPLTLSGKAAWRQGVKTGQAQLALAAEELNLSVVVDQTLESTTATVSLPQTHLRRWMQDHTALSLPERADALTRVAGLLDVSRDKQGFQLQSRQLRVDNSQVTVSYSRLAAGPETLQVAIDSIDLDRYLQAPKQTAASADKPATPDAEAAAVGFARYLDRDLKGELAIARLQVADVSVSNVRLPLVVTLGELQVNPLSFDAFGGSLRADVAVVSTDAGSPPQLRVAPVIQGMQLEPMTTALFGQPKLSGKAGGSAELSTAGRDAVALRKHLSGKLAFTIADGSVHGFNLGNILRRLKARRGADPASQVVSDVETTDFASLSASGQIRAGVLSSEDLSAKSPAFRVTGKGSVDLAQEMLDYRALVTVVESSKGQGGKDLQDLKGLTVPVVIKGPWAKPVVDWSVEDIIKYAAKQRANEKLDEKKNELRQKVEEKLGPGFGELFRRRQ